MEFPFDVETIFSAYATKSDSDNGTICVLRSDQVSFGYAQQQKQLA